MPESKNSSLTCSTTTQKRSNWQKAVMVKKIGEKKTLEKQ